MTRAKSKAGPVTFSDRVRGWTQGLTARLGRWLHQLGVHPDAISVAGLLVVLAAAVLIAGGALQVAGLVLLIGLPLDALDGAVARAMARRDRFGAMLDSTLDRYADGFIFAALSYYFAVQDAFALMALTLLALLGSFMVSYTRARGEGVGVDVKIGLFSRLERVIIILAMLLLPDAFGLPLLEVGVLVLALGTNFTGLQRLRYVYVALKERQGEGN